MPSRGRQSAAPVIVEVKPSNAGASNIAPSSPPASPGTKKARFANTPVQGVTRPLTPIEAWPLWDFEMHARRCPDCYDPLAVYMKGGRLCKQGHELSTNVAEHVYHHAGDVYSRKSSSNHKHVRVELPHGYNQTRSLLEAIDRALRSHRPIISYDSNYPVPSRRRSSPERQRSYYDNDRREVVIEPGKSQRRSSHKPKRYSTVVLQDDVEAGERPPSRPQEKKSDYRRGSLYDTDFYRRGKDNGYALEVREPASRNREQGREERRRRERWQ